MGIFSFFKGRRQRESAIPSAQVTGVQKPADSTPVGQAFPTNQGNAFTGANMDLGQLFGVVGQAIKSGSATVVMGDAKAIQAQGTEMGDQIREVLRQHGVSEDMQPGEAPNVSDPEGMQKQIMEVISQHGLDFSGAGGSFDFSGSGDPSVWSGGDSSGSSDSGSGDSGGGDSGGGDSGGGSSD